MEATIDLKKYSSFIDKTNFVKKTGRVNRIVGLILEGDGPAVSVGSICTIYPNNRSPIQAQVVGFKDKNILLMPLGDIIGIEPGSVIESREEYPTYKVGNALIGRIGLSANQVYLNDSCSPCGGSITRTWTVSDCAGNNSDCVQTISIEP